MAFEFVDLVDTIDQENSVLTRRGLEASYDIIEHLFNGGTIDDFKHESIDNREAVLTILTILFLTGRNYLIAAENSGLQDGS
jgi:hypothetical protein